MAPAQYNNDHLRYSEAPQSNAFLSRSASTSTILSTPVSHVPISGFMLTTEVITHLRNHGCQDITKHLDNDSCTAHPISRGGFGDVYLGKLLDGSQVAIKTMRIHVNTDEAQKPLKHAARELYTWSKCQHPNVLGLLGLVEFRNQIGMVSHWMQNGSLLSYLEKQPETDRCRMSAEICKGLVYLHAEKIVHGDLKGPNVLISNDGTPMLTDFGNAILQESTLRFTATTTKYALSARWAAPELMEGLGMHSFAADVYALGMTILETITGKVPYFEKPELGVYMALVKRELPQQPEDLIPPNSENGKELWELLTSCWAHEWEDRPSAAHVADVVSTLSPKGLKKASVKSNMHGFDPPGSDDRESLLINNLSPELLVIPPRLTGDDLDTMGNMNIDSVGVEFGQSDSFSQGTVSFSGAVEEVISPNVSREASSLGLNTYSNELATPATVPPAVVFGPMAPYIQQPERANYNSGYQPNDEHTARQNQPVGYGSTSPSMQYQDPARFTPPVLRTPTMGLDQDRLRNMLILYYFKHVRQMQYVFAGDATTAVMIHHAQMDPHGAVSLALCSLAALHDSRMRIANGIMPNDQRARGPADKYYQNALHQIQGNKLRNGMLTDADATAALHLVSFWLFAGGLGDWPTVLQIAGDWYEQANLSAHENPMRALMEMNDNAKHASKTTMWMDIFSSISLGKSPRFLKLYRRLLQPNTSFFPGPTGQGLQLENVMGCADGIMLCLAEIADLACWKAEQESKGCLSTLELARRGMIIEAKLRRETRVRPGNQTDTFSGPPGERLGHSISPPSSPPLPSAVLNGEELRRLVSDIFMEAAILYLHTELSGLRPQVAEIKRAVTDTANALAKLPCSEYDRSLVFPLALAGCATDDPEMRDYVRCRIGQLSSTVGNCATAAELIEHVWNRRDSNSGLTIGLREAMCEMGMTILLV